MTWRSRDPRTAQPAAIASRVSFEESASLRFGFGHRRADRLGLMAQSRVRPPAVGGHPPQCQRRRTVPAPRDGRRHGGGRWRGSWRSSTARRSASHETDRTCSARFQSARNVSCTTSAATPRSLGRPVRGREDRGAVPVVEGRKGGLRTADQLSGVGIHQRSPSLPDWAHPEGGSPKSVPASVIDRLPDLLPANSLARYIL